MVPVSIGQGYNAYTPLQMAQATSILANNGVVFRPHLVKELLDHENQRLTQLEPNPDHKLPFSPSNFNYVKQAMARVIQSGTAKRINSGLKYSMGGKTGTAQVVQIAQGKRYNAAALRVQHRDHAWFISFAPVEKPQIAIAVILENGGWGASAAPIARQLSDFYLLRWKEDKLQPASGGGRRTANPLLEGSLKTARPQQNVQAAFEAVAKERAQSASEASAPASAPLTLQPAKGQP